MKKTNLSLIFLALLCNALPVYGKKQAAESAKADPNPPAKLNILETVKVDVDETLSAVSLLFPAGSKTETMIHDLTDHGMFFQINISQTTTANPGQFLPGQGPYISKIAIFQAKEDMTAVRIFTTEKTSAIRNALKVETVENRLLVTIDHQGVVAAKETQAEITSKLEAKESLNAQVPAQPKNALHAQIEKGTYKAAILSALLFAAFLLFRFFHPRLKSRRSKGESLPAEVPTFKKIGSMALAPKQKIVVMEISGEKILLATTPQGIQFLTKLEQSASRPSFAAHLQREHVVQEHPRLDSGQAQTIDLQAPPVKTLPEGAKRVLQAIRDKKYARRDEKATAQEVIDETETPPIPVKSKKAAKSKLSIRIDDDGVTDLNLAQNSQDEQNSPHSVEDITAMIRRKLKDLPKIV